MNKKILKALYKLHYYVNLCDGVQIGIKIKVQRNERGWLTGSRTLDYKGNIIRESYSHTPITYKAEPNMVYENKLQCINELLKRIKRLNETHTRSSGHICNKTNLEQ